jgi:putative ABC transport system permease protein
VESLFQDVRFGLRILKRTPVLTGAILIALALGIGANTAMFSVVDAVLLHPLRFPDPSALSLVWELEPRGTIRNASAANFLDWRKSAVSFTELAAWSAVSYVITGGDRPEQVSGAAVTSNFFHTLGARPILGRTFLPDEDGIENPSNAAHVAVISYRMWQENLGGDPAVLDRILRLNEVPYRVVGVMGPDFQLLVRRHSIWVPANPVKSNRDFRLYTVIGRLKRPRTEAVAEMTSLGRALAETYPKSNKGWSVEVDDFREWLVKRNFRVRLLLLAGALGLVLLIACSNVASLLLVRSSARSRELALRVALGATSARIIRQLLIESLFLSLAGGGLGLILAKFLLQAAPTILPPTAIPTGAPLELSATVLWFTLGISIATGVLFGLAPALAASRTHLQEALKDSARGSSGGRARRIFRESMVVLEVAVALMLVSGAGLMIESIRKLASLDLGFRSDKVLTSRVFLTATKYDGQKAWAFHQAAVERIRALPGVESCALATLLPLMRSTINVPFDLETSGPRDQGQRPDVSYISVTPGYLQTLGIELKRGRMFADSDDPAAPPVVIVNEAFAAKEFPGEEAVGKRILLNRPVLGKDDFEGAIHPEIVGIMANVKFNANLDPIPMLYAPLAQNVWSTSTWIAVRTKLDPSGLTAAMRRELMSLDKDVPVEQAGTIEQLFDNQLSEPRFQSQLMFAFAVVALVLAIVGIYGVNAYAVSERAREIAVRVALGAPRSWVMRDILGQGLRLAAIGVVFGLGGALATAKILSTVLVGVQGQDPVTLAAASVLLMAVAGLACYFPARRAVRIEPASALRED